jgi:hypothetical protein
MLQTDELYAAFRWPAWSEHPLVIKLGDTEEELRSVCPIDLENEDGGSTRGSPRSGGTIRTDLGGAGVRLHH